MLSSARPCECIIALQNTDALLRNLVLVLELTAVAKEARLHADKSLVLERTNDVSHRSQAA